MQATREHILTILKENGEATVSELSEFLGLTTVTIRHHLDTLRREGLVAAPFVRHRKAPGRPQHVYTLTKDASQFFPKRYQQLINMLFEEIQQHISKVELHHIMKQIGKRMADQVPLPTDSDFEEQLTAVVEFLDEQGYMANWELNENEDYLIHIANCPYENVARQHPIVCAIDRAFLIHLLGPSIRRIERAAQEQSLCTYLVHPPSGTPHS